MELSRRERSLRRLIEKHGSEAWPGGQTYRRPHAFLYTRLQLQPALTALHWRSLPWKLDHDGEPQWLVVVDVLSSTSYLVRHPDGSTEALVDSA